MNNEIQFLRAKRLPGSKGNGWAYVSWYLNINAGCLPGNCVSVKCNYKLIVPDVYEWLQFNGKWYVGVQTSGLPGQKLDDSHEGWCSAWTSSLSVTVTQRWQWVPNASHLISAGIAFWTIVCEGPKEDWGDSWLTATVDCYCWERFYSISPNGYTVQGESVSLVYLPFQYEGRIEEVPTDHSNSCTIWLWRKWQALGL